MKGFAAGMDSVVGIFIFSIAMLGAIAAYAEATSSLSYAVSSGYGSIASEANMQRFIYLIESENATGNGLLSNTTYTYYKIISNWSYRGADVPVPGRVLVLNGKLYGIWWDK